MAAGGGTAFLGSDPIAAGSDSFDSGSGALSMEERAKLLFQAGFRGDTLVNALATSEGESGGVWKTNNAGLNPNGSVDWSWMQVNSSAHPWFDTARSYQDPLYSAQAAYRIYQEAGNSLSPWVAYKTGRYRQFLDAAREAARGVEGGPGKTLEPASGKQHLPQSRSQRRSAALQAATGMMQGLGDGARREGRQARFQRIQEKRRTGDELRDQPDSQGDRLVQASESAEAITDEDLLARVQPSFTEMAIAPDEVELLDFMSEGALTGEDPASYLGLDRPSTFQWGGYENGRIPRSAMAQSQFQSAHWFHPGAAEAFDAMYEAAKAEGIELALTDSYRDFAGQQRAKDKWTARGRPEMAATVGNSNHGWGLAIDVATPEARRWITDNGERFGWYHPAWAKPGGNGPEESWHMEFYGIVEHQ